MAERVQIEITVVDKTKAALGNVRAGVSRINTGLIKTRLLAAAAVGALVGFAGVKVMKGIIGVGRQLENLSLRFKFLFGSAEEGAKALKTLTKFAGTVPFSLEQIAAASGNLAVVSKDAIELQKNLEITANVAALSGLDFQLAGEQMQRALGSGIAAADLLRDRGIKALAGFRDGVKYTTEETIRIMTEKFGKDGEFGQASIAMATTFDGLTSMVGDKWFGIQKIVSDSGPFETMKAVVAVLDDTISNNFKNIEEAASKFGQAIVDQAKLVILGSAVIIKELEPVFEVVRKSFNNIVNATNRLPGWFKALGVIGFLALGIKGKLIVMVIGAVFDKIMGAFAAMIEFIASMKGKLAGVFEALGMDETATKMRANGLSMQKEADDIRKKFVNLGNEADSTQEKLAEMTAILGKDHKVVKYFDTLAKKIKELASIEEKLNDALSKSQDDVQEKKMTYLGQYKAGIEEALLTQKKAFDQIKKAGTKAYEGLTDVVTDFVMTGKFKFRDFANAVIRDLVRIAVQAAITFAIKQLFGGFFKEGGKVEGKQRGGLVGENKSYIVGEDGPELFTPGQTGYITPNNKIGGQEVSGGGDFMQPPVNVNFNIDTTDASGFDDLLLDRRSTIVGIINEAMNVRGREGVTS